MASVRLLITGYMRSGTTFLSNLLNSQEDAVVYSDTLRSLFSNGILSKITDINAVLPDASLNRWISELIIKERELGLDIEALNDAGCRSFHDILENSLKLIEGEMAPMVTGIKLTNQEYWIAPLLRENFRIVYIVRDPRDVLISSSKRFDHYNLPVYMFYWQLRVKRALRFTGHPSFLLIRYEDLILDKAKTLGMLQEFLGIPEIRTEDHLISRKDQKYQDNSSFQDVKQLFDKSPVCRWKENPLDKDVMLAGAALKSTIKRLGYDVIPEINRSILPGLIRYRALSVKLRLVHLMKGFKVLK